MVFSTKINLEMRCGYVLLPTIDNGMNLRVLAKTTSRNWVLGYMLYNNQVWCVWNTLQTYKSAKSNDWYHD